MILWRVLPWRPDARPRDPGGSLWFPRELQGAGRHDSPDRYGCLYVGERQLSPIAESLAPFRGSGPLVAGMLERAGTTLALARLVLADDSELIDLDDPGALRELGLRPSEVATAARPITQAYAARLFESRPEAVGLRWWSTIEASLINVTLYDRARSRLEFVDVDPLTVDHGGVREAAELLGLIG